MPGGLTTSAPGTSVLVTELEHHSNFVPWQYIAGRTGADFAAIPIDGSGELALDSLDELARTRRIKVVACGLVSNSLGTINPVERLGAWAHDQGAIMVVDACQAAPHRPIDVQALGCDFLAFTGHKMLAPSGIGVLWGRQELLQKMSPFELGGEMIRSVSIERTTWNELPNKFEAGTPPIAQAYGLGVAIDYLSAVGLEAIEEHEARLTAHAIDRLAEIPGLTLFGPPADRRAGIVSFTLAGVHPHDVAQILDSEGVAVRAGHHCNQPLMHRLGRSRDNSREPLPLHAGGRDRPARRRRSTGSARCSSERHGRALSRRHPRPLQEPARPRRDAGADAQADGLNPLCGDEVSIFVSFAEDGDTIEEVKFQGRGCAISQASTSMLMEMVKGRSASPLRR